jgi:hypothetical protein
MALKIIKIAPTLVTLALVGWIVWPFLFGGEQGEPTAAAKAQANGSKQAAGNTRTAVPKDPFEVMAVASTASAQPKKDAGPAKPTVASAKTASPTGKKPPESDASRADAARVRGMVLSATIIHGPKRIAMIDGRIYEPGDPIRGLDEEPTPFRLAEVSARNVVLANRRGRYELNYTDKLTAAPAEPPPAKVMRGDPDVNKAIAENTGAETDMLRSLLTSPLAKSLMGVTGGGDLGTLISQSPAPARRKRSTSSGSAQ